LYFSKTENGNFETGKTEGLTTVEVNCISYTLLFGITLEEARWMLETVLSIPYLHSTLSISITPYSSTHGDLTTCHFYPPRLVTRNLG